MKISFVGMGAGHPDSLTAEARQALLAADCIIGAPRLLKGLPEGCTDCRHALILPEEIAAFIKSHPRYGHFALAFSGDVGFYSGARRLYELLSDHSIEVFPGLSSVQLMAARLHRPWQDMHLVSAHAEHTDPVPAVMNHATCFFLTGHTGPAALSAALYQAGMHHVSLIVGQNLGLPDERIVRGTPAELMNMSFEPLSVLIADNSRPLPAGPVTHGLPDAQFLRGDVPMTKQAVRAVALSKLAISPHETLYDVGAGTGSVAVEMALLARYGRVYALEHKAEALSLIEQNRLRFGVYNLSCVPGMAPGSMEHLPPPDAVFIGGSRGHMAAILDALARKNPRVRVVVTAIALETVAEALERLKKPPFTGLEVVTLAAADAKVLGGYHMMTGQNPITILSAAAKED